MYHPTDRIVYTTALVTPVVEHWLDRKIAQWVHQEWSMQWPIAPWANALTTELHITPVFLVSCKCWFNLVEYTNISLCVEIKCDQPHKKARRVKSFKIEFYIGFYRVGPPPLSETVLVFIISPLITILWYHKVRVSILSILVIFVRF